MAKQKTNVLDEPVGATNETGLAEAGTLHGDVIGDMPVAHLAPLLLQLLRNDYLILQVIKGQFYGGPTWQGDVDLAMLRTKAILEGK